MRFGFGAHLSFQFAQRYQRGLAVQPHDKIARRQLQAQLAEGVAHDPFDGVARDGPRCVALGYHQPEPAMAGCVIH